MPGAPDFVSPRAGDRAAASICKRGIDEMPQFDYSYMLF
jgi:hypothetical protein